MQPFHRHGAEVEFYGPAGIRALWPTQGVDRAAKLLTRFTEPNLKRFKKPETQGAPVRYRAGLIRLGAEID